jgi:DNA polymerase-3 subunit epsilon
VTPLTGGAWLGYAVVDTETTGLVPGYHHRIAELAVLHLDSDGTATGEWSTLLNPQRDLGPQAIHGIRAADVRRAPTFDQIADQIADLLAGRVVVAHNWSFDAMHLRAEFARLGVDVPFHPATGLCTMRAAGQAMPWARRSLIECCAAAGLPDRAWHTALDDARGAADLLCYLLQHAPHLVEPNDDHRATAAWPWPEFPTSSVQPVQRTPLGHVQPHFLARLVDRIPRTGEPVKDAYLAMLDGALLDRQICDTEAEALVDLAHDLGLTKPEVVDLHHCYLRELSHAVWADGVLTDDERRDVDTVGTLLAVDPATVEAILATTGNRPSVPLQAATGPALSVTGLTLRPGDTVVLTGQMQRGRAEITTQARAVGLRMTTSVSRRTTVVVAADPDSLSGKASDARRHGVPIVNEDTFMRVLDAMR